MGEIKHKGKTREHISDSFYLLNKEVKVLCTEEDYKVNLEPEE